MESIYFTRTASPVGPLVLALSARGLLKLEFDRGQPAEGNDQTWQESPEALAPWLRELNEYFDGYRENFSLPLDLRGTDFQLQCWRGPTIPWSCRFRLNWRFAPSVIWNVCFTGKSTKRFRGSRVAPGKSAAASATS